MPVPDFLTSAAQLFLLAEEASRLTCWSRWLLWQISASSVRDAAVYLPALTAAVREEQDDIVLWNLARYPLPVGAGGFESRPGHPPETVFWYESLVAAWKTHQDSTYPEDVATARLALVRLDGCDMPDGIQRPSRLPEWLAEARRMASGEWRVASSMKLEALAALAAWRPAAGVITAPETLREWVAFWQEIGQSMDPLLKGIAAKSLLNLPEVDLRAAFIQPVPVGELLHKLAMAIPVAAERTAPGDAYSYLSLLEWQPVNPTSLPVEELTEVVRAWLDATRHTGRWCRQMAWRQLAHWDRTGSLTACGIDLLPTLVETVSTENDAFGLWEMARWTPTADTFTRQGIGVDPTMLRELETRWQYYRRFGHWLVAASAWLGGIRLHQAGLASEPPARFMKAYLSAVAEESDEDLLSVLAQWAPGPDAPPDVHQKWQQGWQHRLEDDSVRQVAGFALLRQAVEGRTARALRHAALDVWRTGTKAREMGHRLDFIVSRFHEVRAQLAAGSVPDFEMIPSPPAEKHRPQLTLPPGRIAEGEWRMENEKMEN